MSRNPTEKVKRAIDMLRANPTMTRYRAALNVGVTPSALYNSQACKKLFQQCNKENELDVDAKIRK